MKARSAKHLEDIREAATFIEETTREKTLEQYRKDRLLRQAIERNFEILGEALNRLTREDPDVARRIDHAAQIIAFRNVLIHGYDLVEDTRVWDTIENDVPALGRRVADLLGGDNANSP